MSCEGVVINIPGVPGKSAYQVAVDNGFVGTEAQWLASLGGVIGKDAFTSTTASFVMPAELGTVTIPVGDTSWMAIGQPLFITVAGTMSVVAVVDSTHVTVKNLADSGSSLYPNNAAPLAVIASMSKVTAAGRQGTTGTGAGDMLRANNLNDVVSAVASLGNLGGSTVGIAVFKLGNPAAVTFLRINADNTVTARSAADLKTDLALTISTDVQAWDADLDAIAGLTYAADKIAYFTAAHAAAVATLTSAARALIDDATLDDMLVTLGRVKKRYGLLGTILALDVNAGATDNACAIAASRYIVDYIVVDHPVGVTNITTATLGVFVGAGGGGGTIAADQALSIITTGTGFFNPIVSAVAVTDVLTGANLQVRVGTPQGSACTVDIHIFGFDLS